VSSKTKSGSIKSRKADSLVIAAGSATQTIGKLLNVHIPVTPVRSSMWATAPAQGKMISHIILSSESEMYWNEHNMDLVKNGSVPNVTHTYAEPSKRLNNDLYCKMTHDGCIIAGGDCRENKPGQPFDQD